MTKMNSEFREWTKSFRDQKNCHPAGALKPMRESAILPTGIRRANVGADKCERLRRGKVWPQIERRTTRLKMREEARAAPCEARKV